MAINSPLPGLSSPYHQPCLVQHLQRSTSIHAVLFPVCDYQPSPVILSVSKLFHPGIWESQNNLLPRRGSTVTVVTTRTQQGHTGWNLEENKYQLHRHVPQVTHCVVRVRACCSSLEWGWGAELKTPCEMGRSESSAFSGTLFIQLSPSQPQHLSPSLFLS